MKIAIFYEGACEGVLLQSFLREYCPYLVYTEDPIDFQTHPQDCVLLYDCEGYQNVFPKASEYEYIYTNDHAIVIRDLEDAACFDSVRTEAFSNCSRIAQMHLNLKTTLFAKPDLESVYSADRDLFSTVMQQFYTETFSNETTPANFIEDINNFNFSKGNAEIKELAKKHNMSWNKLRMAKKFFGQMNFTQSNDPYFIRLKNIFSFCSISNEK